MFVSHEAEHAPTQIGEKSIKYPMQPKYILT